MIYKLFKTPNGNILRLNILKSKASLPDVLLDRLIIRLDENEKDNKIGREEGPRKLALGGELFMTPPPASRKSPYLPSILPISIPPTYSFYFLIKK